MKFLHTADWQIGMKAAHAGIASTRVREARIESAKRVIEIARREGADFILLAGDTFESNAIDRRAVQKVGDIMGSFDGPVFVLPGNHDPLEIGSVWDHPVWDSHSNIHIACEARPFELAGGLLYPCPVVSAARSDKQDPTAWIVGNRGETFRIGLAHGSVEGDPAVSGWFPIARDSAGRSGLDYLALGHWHSTTTYRDRSGAIRMAYSGTHETTSFGERDSGNVLIVTIAEPGANPEIQAIASGVLSWRSVEEAVTEQRQLTNIRTAVETMDATQSALIQIRLRGLLFADEAAEISRLEEIVCSRFLHGSVDASGLLPAPADEEWVSGLPAGFLRVAGIRLRELANSDSDSNKRAIAARALRDLYALKAEVSV